MASALTNFYVSCPQEGMDNFIAREQRRFHIAKLRTLWDESARISFGLGSKYNKIASLIFLIASFSVFPWLWQPGNEGTLATIYLSWPFSSMILSLIFITSNSKYKRYLKQSQEETLLGFRKSLATTNEQGAASPVDFEFWRAKRIEILNHTRWLKNTNKDDIPSEIIHFGDYKVRKNWWVGICADLDILIDKGMVTNKEILTKIINFLGKYRNNEFMSRLTNAEDIKAANALIDEILLIEEDETSASPVVIVLVNTHLFIRNELFPGQLYVFKYFAKDSPTKVLALVEWNNRRAAIGMTEEDVTAFLTYGFESEFVENTDSNGRFKGSETAHSIQKSLASLQIQEERGFLLQGIGILLPLSVLVKPVRSLPGCGILLMRGQFPQERRLHHAQLAPENRVFSSSPASLVTDSTIYSEKSQEPKIRATSPLCQVDNSIYSSSPVRELTLKGAEDIILSAGTRLPAGDWTAVVKAILRESKSWTGEATSRTMQALEKLILDNTLLISDGHIEELYDTIVETMGWIIAMERRLDLTTGRTIRTLKSILTPDIFLASYIKEKEIFGLSAGLIANIGLYRQELQSEAIRALEDAFLNYHCDFEEVEIFAKEAALEALRRFLQRTPAGYENPYNISPKIFLWLKNDLPYKKKIYAQYENSSSQEEYLKSLRVKADKIVQQSFGINDLEACYCAYLGVINLKMNVTFEEFEQRMEKIREFEGRHPGYFANLFKDKGYPVLLLKSESTTLDVKNVDTKVLNEHIKKIERIGQDLDEITLLKESLKDNFKTFILRVWAYLQIKIEIEKENLHIITDYYLKGKEIRWKTLEERIGRLNSRKLDNYIKRNRGNSLEEVLKELGELRRWKKALFYKSLFFVAHLLFLNNKSAVYLKLMRDAVIAEVLSNRALLDNMKNSKDIIKRIEAFKVFYQDHKNHLPDSLGLPLKNIPALEKEFADFTQDIFREISKAVVIREQKIADYYLVPVGFLGVFRGRAGLDYECSFDLDKGAPFTRAMHEDTFYYLVYSGKESKGYVGLLEGLTDDGESVLTIEVIQSPSINSQELLQELLGKLAGVAKDKGFSGIALGEENPLRRSFNFDNADIVLNLPEYKKGKRIKVRPIHRESWSWFTGTFGRDEYNTIDSEEFRLLDIEPIK